MIDISLIESARLIRKEFNNLNNDLDRYEVDVKQIANHFLKTSDEIKKIANNSSDKDLIGLRDAVMSKLTDLELESNKIIEKINQINIKMEKLKKEEVDLYNTIKKRYPTLTDDEIKIEIQRQIDG